MFLSEIQDAISTLEFNKAELLIEELPEDLKLIGRILQLKIDSVKGKPFTPILNEFLEILNYAKKTNNRQMEIMVLHLKYYHKAIQSDQKGSEFGLDDRKKAILELREKLESYKDVIDDYTFFEAVIMIGFSIFNVSGENPQISKLIEYFEQYKGDSRLSHVQGARIYSYLSTAYYSMGYLNDALENIEKAAQLSDKYTGNKEMLIQILFDLGNFKEVMKVIYELKEKFQQKDSRIFFERIITFEVECYLWMNDFDQFIEYQKKYQDHSDQDYLLADVKKPKFNPEMRSTTLAKYYMIKGEYEIAEEIFLEFVKTHLTKHLQPTFFLLLHYFYVAQCNVKMNKLEEARKYLNIMQDLRLRSPQNQYFIQYCQKIEADLYFAKPDLESLLYAKQIYEEIITGPFTWFLIYYPSVYNLLEILFSEYSITKNDLLITRIKDLLALTKEDLENKAYYVQLVKFLILETKWYVLTQNASEAFHSLEKGFKLADTYGYVDLSKLIMRIYQFIQTRIDVTGDLTYKLSELASLFDMTRINDEEEINENTELMTYSSQLLGLRETPEALLIVSDIHNIEHEYYFNSVAKNEIKGLMGDLFDKMEVNKQLIRPLSSFERRRIGKNQYLYLNNANYQLFYFYEGNFFQAARKFSLFQDFMYSQQIETLQVDSSLFSNYIQELFQFSETKEIIIDQTTSRITNDFEVIIHPIRLAVVKLLVFYVELTRNTLVKKIQVPTSSLDRNIKKLIEENLVAKEYRFIDSQTEVVYTLTNAGNLLYNRLKAALN